MTEEEEREFEEEAGVGKELTAKDIIVPCSKKWTESDSRNGYKNITNIGG